VQLQIVGLQKQAEYFSLKKKAGKSELTSKVFGTQ
jgi:hypothetical protein